MRLLVLAFASFLALTGCHGRADPPGDAPTGVTRTEGDGVVVMTWDTLPDLTYWIVFAPGISVSVGQTGSLLIRGAISPRVVTGLANGTQYAFAMNATHDGSAAGPTSAPVLATPRLAGDTTTWKSGASLGAANLKAIAFNGSRFVIVGDAATIFAGDYLYASDFAGNPAPPGVNAWLPPTTPVAGFTSDLAAVTFSSVYVALGTDGSVISSSDGFNWSQNLAIGTGITGMNGIAFAVAFSVTPTYVAVGNGGQVYTSNDPTLPWTARTSGTSNDLTSVALINNGSVAQFWATGAGGTLLNSLDGINWNPPLNTNTASTLRGLVYNAPLGMYAAVGDAGTIVTSTDGVNWNPINPPPVAQDLLSITVGGASGSRFLAVGRGGAVVFSDDGLQWSTADSGASLAKVLAAPAMYVAVGDAGANAVSR